jgi:hypothetical protein
LSTTPVNPFDPDALRVTSLADLDLERVLTTVPVRRPKPTEFFRVHPSEDYVLDCFVLEHERDLDREIYLVDAGLRSELMDQLRLVRLFTCMSKRNVVFLWPAKLPTEDGGSSQRAWHRSALEAADMAKTLWVKLVGNKSLGAYEYVKARGDLGEPQWPDKTFQELIELAFKERYIDTLEHPVVKDLNGEI